MKEPCPIYWIIFEFGKPLHDSGECVGRLSYCAQVDKCYAHMVEKMVKGKSLAEFPELLVHTNPKVRYHVKLLMEQLIER